MEGTHEFLNFSKNKIHVEPTKEHFHTRFHGFNFKNMVRNENFEYDEIITFSDADLVLWPHNL